MAESQPRDGEQFLKARAQALAWMNRPVPLTFDGAQSMALHLQGIIRDLLEFTSPPSANQRTFEEWWISASFDTMDPKTMAQRGWDAALKNAAAQCSQHWRT